VWRLAVILRSRYVFAVRRQLPRRLARFNRVVTNPIQGVYAWALPPWAVIVHRGQRTGRLYRTPVVAFRRGRTLAVVVLYGEESGWVRNVLAGGGQVVRAGRTYELLAPRLVPPSDPGVPAVARPLARLSGKTLVAELGEPGSSFGRGPREDQRLA
jgi:deazaflavin-dependent oxidoreductase (nitroreductase family)